MRRRVQMDIVSLLVQIGAVPAPGALPKADQAAFGGGNEANA